MRPPGAILVWAFIPVITTVLLFIGDLIWGGNDGAGSPHVWLIWPFLTFGFFGVENYYRNQLLQRRIEALEQENSQ